MRPISIVIAGLVVAALYVFVMQRDQLLTFAGVDATQQEKATDADPQMVADDTNQLIRVVATHFQAQTIDSAVILRGETRALRQVEVRAETSATVVSDPLRKGAMIRAGEVMCRLDAGTREADLAQARAKLNEAKAKVPEAQARLTEARARLSEAEINNNAAEKLIEGGYASETRLISSRASMRSAEATIASAEAGLSSTQAGIESAAASVAQAKREIDRLTIEAPFDGLLESDAAELGSLMQPGSLCATVIQLHQVKLVGYAPEAQIARIEPNAPARAVLTTGQEVNGFVTFVSRSADSTTRTFEVEILVDNADLAIRDGQTAEISISAPGAGAHLLPQSSLTLNNAGQLGVRTIGDDNVVKFLPATVIQDSPDGVWLGDLPERIGVIVMGQDFVTDGVRVQPVWQELSQ
jgi:multidrug efflux system membrane fusion protein